MKYHYKIKSLNASSQKYGDCEVCKKHASEVFIQSEQREYLTHEGAVSLTFAGCKQHTFGHEKCLLSIRKN